MYNRLLSYFNKYNTVNAHQFGFRKNPSFVMALIGIIDKILEGLDTEEIVAAIYLDLQKHLILLITPNSCKNCTVIE